jgi:pimeloyl-ACP methyl ester carboxylesterase
MGDRRLVGAAVLLLISLTGRLSAQEPAQWTDPSPHSVQLVNVDNNVRVEVLDWGGSGRPVVLLAGLGNTAHVFDEFAPKLTSEYHVYCIARDACLSGRFALVGRIDALCRGALDSCKHRLSGLGTHMRYKNSFHF